MEQNGRPVDPAKIAHMMMVDDEEIKRIINAFKKKIAEEKEDE